MSSSRRFRSVFAVTVVAGLLHTVPALAGDEAAAEALFREAKKLATEGRFDKACPLFAESNRLDRGAGTLIHLGDCYEKNHQSASAWAAYREAASAAQGIGRADWEKLANARAAALEPKLAKLTIRVVEPAEKMEVTRDGAPASQASWGVAIPVDVGTHVVQASAPGRKPFKTSLVIGKDGDRDEVVVPKLEAQPAGVASAPGAAPSQQGAAEPPSDGSSQRTIGFVVGGIGLAGVAAGAITGLIAIGKNNDSKQVCPNDGACASSDAVDAADGAKKMGTISTIAFIAGGVATAFGAVLVLTAPSSRADRASNAQRPAASRGVRLVPTSDGRSAGMTFLGAF